MLAGCWHRQHTQDRSLVISFHLLRLKLRRPAAQKKKNQSVEYQRVPIINCASQLPEDQQVSALLRTKRNLL